MYLLKPMRNRKKLSPAEKAWFGLALYILGADTFLWRTNTDTMSIAFSHWIESRQGRILCMLATVGMISHLWYGLPLPLQTQAKQILGGKE